VAHEASLFVAGDGMEGVDYVFGRNALDMSYVTGYGEVSAQNQHSRW
jgi:endoglucanase